MHRLAAAWQHKARFAIVYIVEAHADDGWRMGQPKSFKNAATVAERAAACRATRDEFNIRIPFVVDDVTFGCGDPAHGERCGGRNYERVYGAWPLRFYAYGGGAQGPLILLKGMPKGDSYLLSDISDFLESL
jgi:hypothetical protein